MMEDNAPDSGRVTRSLRKRLVSVDSDTPSRPGTPNSAKLTSISEICASPSKTTRVTRRNSSSGVATPVKTPAKRGVATSVRVENTETLTPSKSRTRKRTTPAYENEPFQTCLKIPSFPALDEEITQTDLKPSRVTRSQSKSPNACNISNESDPKKNKGTQENENEMDDKNMNTKTPKKRKAGPKSKTCGLEELEDLSDVEISVLGNHLEDIKNKESNITTIVLMDEGTSEMVAINDEETERDAENLPEEKFIKVHEKQNEENEESEQKSSTNNVEIPPETHDNTSQQEKNFSPGSELNEIKAVEDNNFNIKIDVSDPNKKEIELNSDESKISTANSKEDKVDFDSKNNLDILKNSTALEAKGNSFLSDTVEVESESSNIGQETKEKSKNIEMSCTSDDHKLFLKKVDFSSSPSNYITAKNVYAKTPVSLKSLKSFNEICSSCEDDSFEVEYNTKKVETYNKDTESSIIETKVTPMPNLECSVTIINEKNLTSPKEVFFKDGDLLPVKENSSAEVKGELINENLNQSDGSIHEDIKGTEKSKSFTEVIPNKDSEQSTNQNIGELKWVSPSVSVSAADGLKIDVITPQGIVNSNDDENDLKEIEKRKEVSTINNLSESEEEQEDEDKEDEEVYKRNHDFLDDEAIEVCGYESGDSMCSDEQREIEDNTVPVPAESIGSQTTDDQDECGEESGTDDSFFVSDTEEVEYFECDDMDKQIDEDIKIHTPKKIKKTYKRLQCLDASSSSSNVELKSEEQHKVITSDQDVKENLNKKIELECNGEESTNQNIIEKNNSLCNARESIDSGASKNSESALHLQYSDKSEEESNAEEKNSSCKEICGKRNKSEKFNKSVNEFSTDIENTDSSEIDPEKTNDEKMFNAEKLSSKCIKRTLNTSMNAKITEPEVSATSESDSDKQLYHRPKNQKSADVLKISFGNSEKSKEKQKCQTSLTIGISVQSDELHENKSDSASSIDIKTNESESENIKCIKPNNHVPLQSSESDTDKENKQLSYVPKNQKSDDLLRRSFYNREKSNERKECQRSLTIGVTVQNEELEPAVTINKYESASASSADSPINEFESDNIEYFENNISMPLQLGNPLIRTRRQSLALPTNPDMEIWSSDMKGIGKNANRESFGVMSSIDFKPSQSFIDSIQLKKNECKRLVPKRKRMSKSFCGASETHDNSTIDIDIRHLHKKSKLMDENSTEERSHDTIENINSSKLFLKSSSTPKENTIKIVSSNKERILTRCDEILEAANRAKFEAKRQNKKKTQKRISKKHREKKSLFISSDGATNPDNTQRTISDEMKHKAKIHAIMAADALLTKVEKHKRNKNVVEKFEAKQLPPDVIEALGKSAPMKNIYEKKIIQKKEKIQDGPTTSTSTGNFKEVPQSPEKKKKKSTYIQLATGKVSVEPITPKKRIVKAFNGTEFRESPVSPYSVGFKVEKIESSPLSVFKSEKRKRTEAFKDCNIRKAQWTQSGLFKEENILKSRTTKRPIEKEEHSVNYNFKERAQMRAGIKRSNKREMLLLKERREI